jgi:short-subunit dehydrogenase
MRRRRSGQIAIIASLAGLRGIPFSPGYCASKAALNAYGEALAAWLMPEGITVSVVMPGFVATRMSDTVAGPKPLMMSAERAARIIQRGLTAGHRRIIFPYRLYLGMRLLRALPSAWVDSILRRVPVHIDPYR